MSKTFLQRFLHKRRIAWDVADGETENELLCCVLEEQEQRLRRLEEETARATVLLKLSEYRGLKQALEEKTQIISMNSSPGWDRQTLPQEGQPHGWIQWKGTDVCMDVYCLCGAHTHIDAEFLHYVQCSRCGRVYMTNGHIELVPLADAEAIEVAEQVKVTDADD